MAAPGSGRYTKFVPVASPRNELLARLFNARADNGRGEIYGKAYQTDPVAAAKAAVATAAAKVNGQGVGGLIPSDGIQAGDIDMFPNGVKFDYGGAPDFKDVKWNVAGDPANPFTPDLSSPGPGKTEGTQKDIDPNITIEDVKGAKYVPGAPGTGTVSPVTTSVKLGSPTAIGLDQSLTMGKSAASQ